MQAVHRQTSVGYNRTNATTQRLAQQMDNPSANPETGPIITNLPYVSTTPVPYKPPLPAAFDRTLTLNQPAGVRVQTLLNIISTVSGVNVHAAERLLSPNAGVTGSAPVSAHAAHAKPIADGITLPPSIISGGHVAPPGGGGSAPALANGFHYTGTVKGALDAIASRLHATWTYSSATRSARLFRFETQIFSLASGPVSASIRDTAGGSQNTITGQQGQTLKVTNGESSLNYTGKLDTWKTVTAAITKILGGQGSMVPSPSTDTITVTAPFNLVDDVAAYMKRINARLMLTVTVHVAAYQVTVANQDQHGVDWSILYNSLGRLANRVGVSLTTPNLPITGANEAVITAPNKIGNGGKSLYGGSSAFLQALTTLGKTAVLQNTQQVTVNGQPARIQAVTSQAYLAETTSLLSNGTSGVNGVVGAGATLTPGNVQTGFTLQILPVVQPDGKHLLLSTSISVSTLNSMGSVTSGGNSIQLPNVSSNGETEESWLQSGQTLVLAGFETRKNSNTTNTLFGRTTWLFGGNRALDHSRNVIVFVITPVVTDASVDDARPMDANYTY
ncbi:MAG TPA: hypothetical protein VFQ88_09585 [Nevskiaceae bacterium]|nr:hypothetical protein [Nevskiaceae bacterium]